MKQIIITVLLLQSLSMLASEAFVEKKVSKFIISGKKAKALDEETIKPEILPNLCEINYDSSFSFTVEFNKNHKNTSENIRYLEDLLKEFHNISISKFLNNEANDFQKKLNQDFYYLVKPATDQTINCQKADLIYRKLLSSNRLNLIQPEYSPDSSLGVFKT
ncbi:MAG: hypothetical protein LW817_06740 [Candidatus Caenarcaniphilales bacterium]|jgi:hypothetical protein|nr:hypothetical protein [Candidatus Caenarcaniphilales bacterium]